MNNSWPIDDNLCAFSDFSSTTFTVQNTVEKNILKYTSEKFRIFAKYTLEYCYG